MTHREATSIIYDYISELGHYRKRKILIGVEKQYFKQESYSRWAAYELIVRLKDRSKPPTMIVEDFIRTMDSYSCVSQDSSFIFSVAKDTAEYILDLIL